MLPAVLCMGPCVVVVLVVVVLFLAVALLVLLLSVVVVVVVLVVVVVAAAGVSSVSLARRGDKVNRGKEEREEEGVPGGRTLIDVPLVLEGDSKEDEKREDEEPDAVFGEAAVGAGVGVMRREE